LKAIRVTIIILFSYSFLEASDALDGKLRKELFALNYNSEIAGELLIKLDYAETPSPLIIAYKAVCEAHIAKVESNLIEKYRYLTKANKHLSEAIDLDKKNVEIRFLRYAFQIQTPGKTFRSWERTYTDTQTEKKRNRQTLRKGDKRTF
jgi:hypothetical protein